MGIFHLFNISSLIELLFSFIYVHSTKPTDQNRKRSLIQKKLLNVLPCFVYGWSGKGKLSLHVRKSHRFCFISGFLVAFMVLGRKRLIIHN